MAPINHTPFEPTWAIKPCTDLTRGARTLSHEGRQKRELQKGDFGEVVRERERERERASERARERERARALPVFVVVDDTSIPRSR